jgi:hypothetical protein
MSKTRKASKVIRKTKTEEPERITVKGDSTRRAPVTLLQDSALGDLTIERLRTRAPVRGIEL